MVKMTATRLIDMRMESRNEQRYPMTYAVKVGTE